MAYFICNGFDHLHKKKTIRLHFHERIFLADKNFLHFTNAGKRHVTVRAALKCLRSLHTGWTGCEQS